MDSNDMKENFFNVHLCHICKSKDSFYHSKLCSACKLISYCSSEHQKADRKSHRSFCEAAQSACRIMRGEDVFDAATTVLLLRTELKELIAKISVPDFPPKSERTKVKMGVSQLIGKSMSRHLNRQEMNMIFFPKHCAVCFTRKNIQKEFVCTNCFGVAYCSAEHQRIDNHKKICSDFRNVLDMDLFMLNVNFDSPEIHLIKPDDAVNLKLDACDIKSFIAKYVRPGAKFEEEALISFYFSCVLTFAHAISRIPNFALGKKLTIHIVGAHAAHEARILEHWENLLHLYPGVLSVTIVHIGPCIYGSPVKLKLCDDCNTANRSIDILFCEQRYHEYHHYPSVMKKPDVIIAYNCGLYDHDPAYDPWGPSLPLFFQYDSVPFILTEAFDWEVEKNLERLLSAKVIQDKKVRVVVKCEKNPFRNLRPWKDWTDPDFLINYKNNYVSALIVESG